MHTWNLETYYKKCLLALPTGVRLHVFSDEPHLCKEWLLETVAAYSVRAAITWSESKTDIEALYEMSLCQGGAIVANSTFSWWGAYFARANAGEGYRAYYPDAWGLGLPPPTDLIPSWGEVVATEWNPAQN
jgi:hypothetical protein